MATFEGTSVILIYRVRNISRPRTHGINTHTYPVGVSRKSVTPVHTEGR